MTARHTQACRATGFCLMCALEELQRSVFSRRKPVSPVRIVRNLRAVGRQLRVGLQHDAHECLRLIIDALERSCGSWKVIQSIFNGKLCNEVRCLECHSVSRRFDTYQDLSLNVSKARSVIEALALFCKPEKLYGDNKYRCGRCRKLVCAIRRTKLDTLPPILCVQLKLFQFSGMGSGKVNKQIHFKPVLSLEEMSSGNKILYDLYALVVHYGYSCSSGHYISYVKSASGSWFRMDDSNVRPVSFQKVLSEKPYLLFYVRRTQSKSKEKKTEHMKEDMVRKTSRNPIEEFDISKVKSYLFVQKNATCKKSLLQHEKQIRRQLNIVKSEDNLFTIETLNFEAKSNSDNQSDHWSNVTKNTILQRQHINRQLSRSNLKKRKAWDIAYDKGKVKKCKRSNVSRHRPHVNVFQGRNNILNQVA